MNFARALLLLLALPLATAAALAEEPEAVYGRYHRVAAAGDVEEMQRYVSAAQRAEIAAMSAGQKEALSKMNATTMPRAYTLKRKISSPDGRSARLFVITLGQADTLYGVIRMAMEGGEWKVGEVRWNSEEPMELKPVPAKPAAAAAPQPARAAPLVGSTTGAPERKLGTQKPDCVFKPVMTAEDLENCR
ncbi:MAG TPA: hypothetical protein VN667_07075 [Burkholderiales bacterium]|nr:hypothetical protein [Burkholderiales bacterium]